MAQINASSVLLRPVRVHSAIRWGMAVVAGSALVAACAHVSVPLFFTPVPVTLQSLAVLLLGLFLEPAVAFGALALYLFEGAAGLPVFTPQGLGGIAQLIGPTGGYLLSYPFVAALVSFLYRRLPVSSFWTALLSAVSGSVVILAMGTIWLAVLTHQTLAHTALLSIVPFLTGDALKVCLAAALAAGWLRARKIETAASR